MIRNLYYKITDFFKGIKNLYVWFPIIWNDRPWDYTYIHSILLKKLKLMSKSFEKYSNHLNVEQDLKYINLAIKLLEMEISEVYANEIYSIKYSYDIYDEYIKKNKKLANELLKNNPELINNKFTFLVHIADNKQNKCKTLLFKILNEKINSWWY